MKAERPNLKLDWCSHEAALFAAKHWHYSGCLPAGRLIKVGVWEYGTFIGCVLFSRGATPQIGRPYNLKQTEICELTRIALKHHDTPVSRIGSIALRFLKKNSPGLRLVVSYADPEQDHHGGIYQAMNWIYEGAMAPRGLIKLLGRLRHSRSINSKYGSSDIEWLRKNVDPKATLIKTKPKHKYLMPLDADMRRRLAGRAKPYPKKRAGSIDSDAPGCQPGEGGVSPTPALQNTVT